MAATLHCVQCEAPCELKGLPPAVCPACGNETQWIVGAYFIARDHTRWDRILTHNDKKFLRSLRIAA